MCNCGLPAAGGAHNCGGGGHRDAEGDVVEDGLTRGVGKGHRLEANLPLEVSDFEASCEWETR